MSERTTSEAGGVRVDAGRLVAFLTDVYAAAGLPATDAAACAAQTADAELRGVVSHGCVRVGVFVERLRHDTVNPTPDVRVVRERPGWTLLDGDRGMSAVGGRRAMERAIVSAAANGIGAAGVRRVSHTGHVGWFASMALERGMIGIVASSAAANMAPWGGADRLLGNNPIAVAVPSDGEGPVVFDMATSTVARGHVILAAKRGDAIPAGWALDAEGRPTTDARRALDGTMLPLGGYKGAGLALALELVTDALTGNVDDDRPDWLATDREFLLSMLCIAIDPRACLGPEFGSIVASIVSRLKGSRLADGFDAIRMPGESRGARARDAAAHGVVLAPALVGELDAIATRLGVRTLTAA